MLRTILRHLIFSISLNGILQILRGVTRLLTFYLFIFEKTQHECAPSSVKLEQSL